MKKYQLILILALVGFCFTEDQDICSSGFETKLEEECVKLDASCELTDNSPNRCISKKNSNCRGGDGDEYICYRIYPNDYPERICYYDSANDECKERKPTCGEYSSLTKIDETHNYCSLLDAGEKKTCHLSDISGDCTAYYDSCSETPSTECNGNLPSNFKQICELVGTTCTPVERKCDNPIYDVTETQCHELKSSSNLKACVYSNGVCKAEFIKCDDITNTASSSICNNKYPLIKDSNNNYYYDDINKCAYVTDETKCQKLPKTCAEYDGDDENTCLSLKPIDANQSKKRCVFDASRTPNKCYEEYITCEEYNDDISSKYSPTRPTNSYSCENIKLLEQNRRCIYIRETDKCITKDIYTTCDGYDGTDKYTCESIKSSVTNAYCVLTSDSKCVERKDANMTCEDAIDEEDCHFYAKPVVFGKRCIYSDKKCMEVFQRCEDYNQTDSDVCNSLVLYNGKKCYFESNQCKSRDKICKEASNKDECLLISKTGVSNPAKKVCDWITLSGDSLPSCAENYKYCSDYRGSDITTCQNIKPYDKSGNYVDYTSECEKNDDKQCQRISKSCGDADNPLRCSIISPKIKDNHMYHCVYDNKNNDCNRHKKKCEDITSSNSNDCEDNIPEDYLTSYCVYDSTNQKCVTKKRCHAFDENYHADLCNAIQTNCLYDSNGCHEEKYPCEDKVFFSLSDGNKAICESIEVSSPNKLCTINEDGTACKEIFKNVTWENATTENGSESLMKGIQFIAIILSLLIFI